MSQTQYGVNWYLPAWTSPNGSTLVPAVDARANDFGAQLLTQFKQYARITYAFDDNILPTFIDAAIGSIEQALEYPIFPRSYDWDVGPDNVDFARYEVPLRNSDAVGQQYDAVSTRAFVLIDPPTAWPVLLKVGYDSADDIPQDLLVTIFALASSYEQLRGAVEVDPVRVPMHIASRYGILRC